MLSIIFFFCQVTLFHFEDEPRPSVAKVLTTLKDQAKLRTIMLTGDHELSAKRVAKAVGIDEVYHSLKPEDKLNHVKSTSRETGDYLVHFHQCCFMLLWLPDIPGIN